MNGTAIVFLSVFFSILLSYLTTLLGWYAHSKEIDKTIDDFLKDVKKICEEYIHEVNQRYRR